MRRLQAPIKDAIDKRNYQEEIQKSVVKGFRVQYQRPMAAAEAESLPEEPIVEETEQPDDEVMKRAEEIMRRLNQEAKEDEVATVNEWTEKLLQERPEEELKSLYNSTTGSYSGMYGQGPVSDEAKQLADEILKNVANHSYSSDED